MNRLPDWPMQLDAILASRLRTPFRWGENDCCLFAADAVLAMTGVDLAAGMRNHKTAREALAVLREHGGVDAIATAALGAPCGVAQAQQGDVVAIAAGRRLGLAVCIDSQHAVGPSCAGLAMLPMSRAVCCWRVGDA